MDSVLRQSKAMCPFMKKASVATLRAMSTATRPQASPCGGTISKLQVLAHRCPVMGKAMVVQSARFGRAGIPAAHPVAGISTYPSGSDARARKARLHTGRSTQAQPVEGQPLFNTRNNGEDTFVLRNNRPASSCSANSTYPSSPPIQHLGRPPGRYPEQGCRCWGS